MLHQTRILWELFISATELGTTFIKTNDLIIGSPLLSSSNPPTRWTRSALKSSFIPGHITITTDIVSASNVAEQIVLIIYSLNSLVGLGLVWSVAWTDNGLSKRLNVIGQDDPCSWKERTTLDWEKRVRRGQQYPLQLRARQCSVLDDCCWTSRIIFRMLGSILFQRSTLLLVSSHSLSGATVHSWMSSGV